MPDAKRSCATCLWWHQNPKDEEFGQCRRHAPRATREDPDNPFTSYACWYVTHGEDWCGEWQPPAVEQQQRSP